jgi:hypothetical protein
VQRTDTLFAISGAALLFTGLIVAKFLRQFGEMSLHWPGSSTMRSIPSYAPCCAIAGLFGVFAFFCAIGYLPFSETESQWHFWLSFSGVILFGLGYVAMVFLGHKQPSYQASQGALTVVLLLVVTGPVAFLCGQVLFAFSLSRALFDAYRH